MRIEPVNDEDCIVELNENLYISKKREIEFRIEFETLLKKYKIY